MPTYEYECQSCHDRVEAVQRFTDPALTVCARCGGELRKVFSAVGVVFKGSGFYKTDSRGADKSSTPSTATTPATSPSTETSSTPAATTASTTTSTSSASTSD
ncbi:MAG: FmdB family zinc ribbon protein [Acidimicrobiales bacterium]|jgi:putative FmdB family regulatory protein